MSFARPGFALALVLVLALFAPAPAPAGLLGASSDYTLYDVDTSTAALTNPRSMGNKVNMIAVSPSGTLYGASQGTPSDFPPGGQLFTVQIATGAATLVGVFDQYIFTEGDIAFDPTTGILYGVDGPGLLVTINTTTAAVTTVGNIGTTLDLSAMAFDSAGNLYVVNSFGPTLLKVNKSTAAILDSKPLVGVNQEVGGLAFRPGDDVLFHASGASTSKLDVVDPTTGFTTPVGPLSVSGGIWALTFAPDGPTDTNETTWGQVKRMFR